MGHRCILICLTYPYTNTVVYYTWTLQTVGSVTLKKEKAVWWGDFNTECKYYSDWGPPVQKGPVCC